MKSFMLHNGIKIEAVCVFNKSILADIDIIFKDVIVDNFSLKYCEVEEMSPKYKDKIYNLGLRDEEKPLVYEMLLEVLKGPLETNVSTEANITALYEDILAGILDNADSGSVGDNEQEIYIRKEEFVEIVAGISDNNRDLDEILQRLKRDKLLRVNENRNTFQIRVNKKQERVYCIFKKGIFKDVNIGHSIVAKADNKGGKD